MPSLKRPVCSGVTSSLRRGTAVATASAVNTSKRRQLPNSDDLFSSSPEDDIIQSSFSKKKSSKKANDNLFKDESLFCNTVTEAGLQLHTGDLPNVLSCEQITFQRSVTKGLSSSPANASRLGTALTSSDETVTEFLTGLENYLKGPHRLKWSLLYTETAPDCSVANRGNQDSLVRLLLNIDALQPPLVTLLTDTLLTLAYEQSENDDSSLASLVLGNLRWLEHVVKPEHLMDAVLLVLQAATTTVQKEIIHFIPNIITDEFHAKIADSLIDLYESTPCLCPAILDALHHLTLTDERISEVHHTVLRNLHATAPPHLPCVTRFLLHNTHAATAYQVLSDVREKLYVPAERENAAPSSQASQQRGVAPQVESNAENAGISVLLFSTIKMALLLHKYLTNAWLKTIEDVEHSDVRPVDVWLLLLVHDAVPGRRRAVYSILRNKIRAGLQYDALLTDTLSANPAVLHEYFDSVKRVAGVMLRSPEPAFSHFGASIYKIVFECSSGTASQQQEIIVALLAHLGDDQHVRLAALTLLASLAHQHTAAMAKFAIFLKGSLEQLERLSLQESRCLLDAVTAVAANDPNTALHSDLAIYTRKLLNQTDIRYKRLGVLSAVLTLKNSSGESNPGDSSSSSSGSTSGGGEDVLEVVRACTANCPPASALFMDELASTILRDGINTRLERWLSGKLEETFETVFIQDLESDTPPIVTGTTGLKFVLAFDLEVEEQAAIAVNLGELVEKLELHRRQENKNETRSADAAPGQTILITLAPHFRLLRMVVSHLNGGELSAIDGLLGCPVYYPHSDSLQPETFATLSIDNQTVLLSCLFFAANWFRELINAFVTQKTPELKKKVYSRLRHLLEVEQSLSVLLPLCPSYQPHLAASHIDPSNAQPPPVASASGHNSAAAAKKKTRKPKQKKKQKRSGGTDGPVDSTAVPGTAATQSSQLTGTLAPSQLPATHSHTGKQDERTTADLGLYKAYLRELQLDVFCLLFKTMSLDTEMQSAGNQLSVPEAEFLLTDLNLKLGHVFGAVKRSSTLGKTSAGKDVGFWHLDLFSAEELATQAQRFVKPLCVHLDTISKFFKSLIDDHDGILDCSGVLNERTLPVARVQGLLLTALQHLLAWPSLYRQQHLYTSMLRIICRKQWPSKSVETVQELSQEQLLWGAFCYARRQVHALLELGSGVLVVRLLEAVVTLAKLLNCESAPHGEHDEEEEQEQDTSDQHYSSSYGYKLGLVVATILRRNWTTAGEGLPDKGAVYNQRVAALLQCWLRNSPRPLEVIQQISSAGVDEYIACDGKEPVSETFPTLNKGTLVIYVSCMLSNLSSSVKKALATTTAEESGHRRSTEEEYVACLKVWTAGVDVYTKIFRVVKLHHSRHLLSACLKYARPFIELFLSLGMPVMDSCLQSHRTEVCQVIKTLQAATRILQIVCTESKVNKDVSLTSYVPMTRRSMASLVFRVKAMLVHHNCSQAFWLGVLKNRNLDGEIIPSQQGQEEPERNTDAEEKEAEAMEEVDDNSSRAGGEEPADESDSVEGVELEDDRSDVELDDDDEICSKQTSKNKKRKIVRSDEDEGDEMLDGITDYSSSF
uniref:Fanconi anemia group D2 protein homolog n=2 Tax=Hirondellea gigas TaxID=1518452 RepID=A0A2P2I1W6_9CRUS